MAHDIEAPKMFVGVWPLLSEIGLTPDQIKARANGIGGSDANTILSGEDARIIRLWQEKRRETEPEDLSRVLPVQIGCWTEAFNRQWFTRETGLEVIDVGRSMACSKNPWRLCTLDGFIPEKEAVFEAKHTGAWSKPDEILARYAPQLQHNMAVCGSSLSFLSVIYGNAKWEVYEVAADWMYQEELLEAERRFWDCVQNGGLPATPEAPAAPRPVATREVDMSGSNSWTAHAADWLASKGAAKTFDTAAKELKALVEADVSRAHGSGVQIKRSKSGSLTITELKETVDA